jgi:hypothetical protein
MLAGPAAPQEICMPHQRKKSLKEGKPPKRRAASRRKSQPDPIAEMYAGHQEGLPAKRSKRPRKTSGGTRTRSGPSTKQRGKKVAAVKRPTRRSRAA